MRQKLFKASEMYKPTPESIAEQNRRHSLYSYYGIPIGVFTDNSFEYTKDELKAIDLIRKNKNIPSQLHKKLLDTKIEREKRIKSNTEQIERPLIIDEELENFIQSKQ